MATGFKAGRLNPWLYGKHSVHKSFPSALAEVLELDEVERRKLAVIFTYGQDESITAEWLDSSGGVRRSRDEEKLREEEPES